MRAIGFRVAPKEIHYTIVEKADNTFSEVTCAKVRVPVALTFPQQLNYLRKTFTDIISEYDISCAGIRITESNAQSLSIVRISIEAIIQELICNSAIDNYFIGQISTISAKLGIDRKDFKKIIDGEIKEHRGFDFSDYNDAQKEALLVAFSSTI